MSVHRCAINDYVMFAHWLQYLENTCEFRRYYAGIARTKMFGYSLCIRDLDTPLQHMKNSSLPGANAMRQAPVSQAQTPALTPLFS